MKKSIVTLTVLFITAISLTVHAQNLETEAYLSDADIIIDGNAVSSCAYNIHGSNYFKLRDIAYMLRGSSFL